MTIQYVVTNHRRVPVIAVSDLLEWLEGRVDATEDNGLHVCVDTLIEEIRDLAVRTA